MREILFRGKRVDNGEWVYGWYVFRDVEAGFKEQKHYILTHDECGFLWHEVVSKSVGQYIGWDDKNHIAIFEGDILQSEGVSDQYLFVVAFGTCGGVKNVEHYVGYSGFYLKPANKVARECHHYGLRDDIVYFLEEGAVVIGNIHDNPELLENSQNFS